MNTLICITHNKVLFLKDFIKSFFEHAHPKTQLVIGAQGCTDGTVNYLIQAHFPRRVIVFFYPENSGLNRYDDVIKGGDQVLHFQPNDILIDVDDDSILFPGFEHLFEQVLTDKSFGWVGLQPSDTAILTRPGGNEWTVNNLRIIEAAVGGGLAATRFETWRDVGGFGIGGTNFDLEDARYQRKCLGAGYRCGIIADKTYEHHGSWEWHIRYGTWHQRMDNLFECMLAGQLDEVTYRAMLMEYTAQLESQSDATPQNGTDAARGENRSLGL